MDTPCSMMKEKKQNLKHLLNETHVSWGGGNMQHIDYENISEDALRIYGNFRGFSVIRKAYDAGNDWIEVDGRLMDMEDFENWLYSIKE